MCEEEKIESLKRHLKYYNMLEKDLFKIDEYVEIERGNFCTYSIFFSKIIQTVCGEIDSLFKIICAKTDCKKPKNIKEYYEELYYDYRTIALQKVNISGSDIEITPWESWQDGNNAPPWWKNYNVIKHDLNSATAFKEANLENAIYALAGLYILNRYAIYILLYEDKELMKRFYMTWNSKKLVAVSFQKCYTYFAGYSNFSNTELENIINQKSCR